jgi:formate transporter
LPNSQYNSQSFEADTIIHYLYTESGARIPIFSHAAMMKDLNEEEEQQEDQQRILLFSSMGTGLVTNDKDLEAQDRGLLEGVEVADPPSTNTDSIYTCTDNSSDIPRRVDPTNTNTSVVSKRRTFNNNEQQPTTTCTTLPLPTATKAPKDTLKAVYAAGIYKAALTWDVLVIQSFMAGVYIAAAGHLFLAVGGGVLGATLFPTGLLAVVLTSAELFTGDSLVFMASVLGKQVPFHRLVRNWTVSWISNFSGSLAWAVFLSYLSGALVDSGATELAIHVAEKKALNELPQIFLKAVGANFMVCVAVWQATCAQDVAGKVLALWFPTAAFVMMGFDHCVANMFFLPMGMMLGAKISVGRLFAALAVASLGNVVGGGIFVGAVYWYVFDSMASLGSLTARIRHNIMQINHVSHHRGGRGATGRNTMMMNLSSPPPPPLQHEESYNV